MMPAEDLTPEQLVGRRVAFASGLDHDGCWHTWAGLERGTVVRIAQTLAQKAEMVGAEAELPEDWEDYEEVPRVWVKADPCASFRRGCEAAVETGCLRVLGPGGE
jgi:hypothetical protein